MDKSYEVEYEFLRVPEKQNRELILRLIKKIVNNEKLPKKVKES